MAASRCYSLPCLLFDNSSHGLGSHNGTPSFMESLACCKLQRASSERILLRRACDVLTRRVVGNKDLRRAFLSSGPDIVRANHQTFQLGRSADEFWGGEAYRRSQAPRNTNRLTQCMCSKEDIYPDVSTFSVYFRPTLDPKFTSQSKSNAYQREKLRFWIVTVSTPEELLAAATLRAQLFYSYPEYTSVDSKDGLEGIKARLSHDFALRDILKSRIDSEFQRDSKMQLLNMKIKSLLAVCKESNERLLSSSQEERNLFTSPPVVTIPMLSSEPLVAIGTLDIQINGGFKDGTGTEATVDVNTVTFQLHSLAHAEKRRSANRQQISKPGSAGHSLLSVSSFDKSQSKHGYIFNVCVTETVRRQGVATVLMREAQQVGQQMQLQTLYVHVEANNTSALALYQKLGYTVEEEESFEVESRFQRSRRILLGYRCK